MIKFKACPKCRGDLHLNIDEFGPYLSYFQWGYMIERKPSRLKAEVSTAGTRT